MTTNVEITEKYEKQMSCQTSHNARYTSTPRDIFELQGWFSPFWKLEISVCVCIL